MLKPQKILFYQTKIYETTNLVFVTGIVERVLVQMLDGDQVVGFQDRVAIVECENSGVVFDADSEARGTLRRSRWRLTEEERREREREEGDGTVVIGHYSFDRTVVGDADVA